MIDKWTSIFVYSVISPLVMQVQNKHGTTILSPVSLLLSVGSLTIITRTVHCSNCFNMDINYSNKILIIKNISSWQWRFNEILCYLECSGNELDKDPLLKLQYVVDRTLYLYNDISYSGKMGTQHRYPYNLHINNGTLFAFHKLH